MSTATPEKIVLTKLIDGETYYSQLSFNLIKSMMDDLQKENQEMREALNQAVKILEEGCLVYDQHVTSGSSSFRSDAQWFIDTNSSKFSNSSKEEVK